jgi:hypothetical protein
MSKNSVMAATADNLTPEVIDSRSAHLDAMHGGDIMGGLGLRSHT